MGLTFGKRTIAIKSEEDIPDLYKNTPIAALLEFNNLNRPFEVFDSAQLLVGMCMDYRKHLNIPENFAFIIRTGGANMRYSTFRVSYAIAVGGVRHIALIGHTNCGMVNLAARKNLFVQGMIENAGWSKEQAIEHFNYFEPIHEIGNEIDFISGEVKRLRLTYPKITVAPMMYRVEDNLLYLVDEVFA